MAQTVVKMWTNFARFGNPATGATVPAWPTFASGSGGNVAMISAGNKTTANVTVVQGGVRTEQCKFWSNVSIPANVVWGPKK